MVDLCFKSLVVCNRIMVGLSCMFSISFIMSRRLELIWHVFHVIMWVCMVEVCVGCVCGGGCGHGNV